MTKLVQEETIVTQWFSNHHFPLSKLRALTLRELKRPLELIKAAATRFSTHTLVGERLLELKLALQATVCAADYVAKQYKDTGNTIEDGGTGRRTYCNKGATSPPQQHARLECEQGSQYEPVELSALH